MTGYGYPPDYRRGAEDAAKMAGVPVESFVNLIDAESGYKDTAFNPRSGAIGLGQLLPGAVKDVDAKFAFGGAPMANPIDNLKYSAHYLRMMVDQFGNIEDALRAYNWGPGNVRKWIDGGRDPTRVPLETRKYVQNITGGKMGPWAAGWAVNNFVASNFNYAMARGGLEHDVEVGYDPFEHIKGTGFEPYASAFVDVRSRAETDAVMQNITNLMRARERLAEMPWHSRLFIDAVTSVIDLPSAVPLFGWASKARTIGGAMVRGGADVALQAAAVEGALHGVQEGTRTWQESAAAISTAGALGAILGPAVRSLGRTGAEAEAKLVAGAKELEALRDVPASPLTRGDGGAASTFDIPDLTIADGGVRKTVDVLASTGSPVRNPEYVLQAAAAPTAKVTASDLVGNRLETVAAREGQVPDTAAKLEKPELSLSVLRAARMYMAQGEVAASKIRDAFVEMRYKGNVPRILPGIRAFVADAMGVSQRRGVMTFDEFNREVHHALVQGEARDTLAPAERAAVEKATKAARDFTDTMRSKLTDAGLTSEARINKVLEMDPAYFIRSYDRAIIKAKSADFSEMVASWFVRENEENAQAIAEAAARMEKEQASIEAVIARAKELGGPDSAARIAEGPPRSEAELAKLMQRNLQEYADEYQDGPLAMSAEDAVLFGKLSLAVKTTPELVAKLRELHLKYLKELPEKTETIGEIAGRGVEEVRAQAATLRSMAKELENEATGDQTVGGLLKRTEKKVAELKIRLKEAEKAQRAVHGRPDKGPPSARKADDVELAPEAADLDAVVKRVNDLKEQIALQERSLDQLKEFMESVQIRWEARAGDLIAEAKALDEEAKVLKDITRVSWKAYLDAETAMKRGEDDLLTPQDIKELVDGLVDRITGSAYGRGFDPLEPVKYRGSTKERTLPIPTDYVSPGGNAMTDFIDHDITGLLLKHGRYVGTDVALAERGLLPKHGLEERKAAIVKEYHDLRDAATTEAERTRIINEQADVLYNIDAMIERMRGRFGIPDGAGGTAANRWAAGLINYNIATKLLGQTISSIPDIGKIVFVHGMKRTLGKGIKTYAETFSDPELWKAFKGDFERSGTMLEMALTGRLHELWDVLDNYGQTSKFERGLHWMAQNTFTLNLSRPWNTAMQHIAAIPTMDRMLRAIIKIADGEEVDVAERTALARLGIGQRQAKMIASQRKHFIDHKGVLIANTDAWDDSAQSAGTLFRGALGQWVDDIIVRPQEERPFWASSSWGRVLFQFKAFSQASTTATLLSGLQRRDAAVFQGAALMMALGVATAAFKEKLQGREVGDWETLLLHGADQSGLAGIFTEPMRMIRHVVKGDYDRLIGQAAGPTAGTAENAVRLFGALADEAKATFSGDESKWTDRDTRRAARMVPWLMLTYNQLLYTAAERGIKTMGAGEEP